MDDDAYQEWLEDNYFPPIGCPGCSRLRCRVGVHRGIDIVDAIIWWDTNEYEYPRLTRLMAGAVFPPPLPLPPIPDWLTPRTPPLDQGILCRHEWTVMQAEYGVTLIYDKDKADD